MGQYISNCGEQCAIHCSGSRSVHQRHENHMINGIVINFCKSNIANCSLVKLGTLMEIVRCIFQDKIDEQNSFAALNPSQV